MTMLFNCSYLTLQHFNIYNILLLWRHCSVFLFNKLSVIFKINNASTVSTNIKKFHDMHIGFHLVYF